MRRRSVARGCRRNASVAGPNVLRAAALSPAETVGYIPNGIRLTEKTKNAKQICAEIAVAELYVPRATALPPAETIHFIPKRMRLTTRELNGDKAQRKAIARGRSHMGKRLYWVQGLLKGRACSSKLGACAKDLLVQGKGLYGLTGSSFRVGAPDAAEMKREEQANRRSDAPAESISPAKRSNLEHSPRTDANMTKIK